MNQITRLYLIGRRYLIEKNENGVYDHTKSTTNKLPQNEEASGTSRIIAKQLKVGHATVERAFSLTSAIDTIVSNTGINRMSILSGDIKGTQDEIKELASKDTDSQKRIVDLILNEGELSIY